jgi:dTDP-4-dehydrorhamnose reductase
MDHGLPSPAGAGAGGVEYHITALYHQLPGFPEAVEKKASASKVKVTVRSCNLTDFDNNRSFFDDDKPAVDLCIHTAALSSPRACEADPEKANAINIPKSFFETLSNVPIIALSTDQVYDGTLMNNDRLYKEDVDTPNPLNVYGQTKLDMETYLKEQHPSKAICLRSSIMLGRKAPLANEAHDTFLHFCASRDQQETTFFTNEYRSVVSVPHVCQVVNALATTLLMDDNSSTIATTATNKGFAVYNMGGPNRVHRYDMAEAVFAHFGYDPKYLVKAQQTVPTSPLDISMDSSKLQELLFTGGMMVQEQTATTLQALVEYTFATILDDDNCGWIQSNTNALVVCEPEKESG